MQTNNNQYGDSNASHVHLLVWIALMRNTAFLYFAVIEYVEAGKEEFNNR